MGRYRLTELLIISIILRRRGGGAINFQKTLFPFHLLSLIFVQCRLFEFFLFFRKMAESRRDGSLPWIRPDSKTQVSDPITMVTTRCHSYLAGIVYCTGACPLTALMT